MRTTTQLLLLLLSLSILGCAGTGQSNSVEVKLMATPRNAGKIGQATLTARNDLTDLSAFVSGVPYSLTLPPRLAAYIYPGTCAQLGAQPAYSLNRTLLTSRLGPVDGWRLSRSANVPLAKLRATAHALVLRTAPADGEFDLFCGDIP